MHVCQKIVFTSAHVHMLSQLRFLPSCNYVRHTSVILLVCACHQSATYSFLSYYYSSKKGVSGTIVGSAVGLSASCKQLENTIAQRGLRSSVRFAHGHMALMSGWFQAQFHHSTIPAAEWGTSWADAGRQCEVVPTVDRPRINLTFRYIRRHSCELHTMRVGAESTSTSQSVTPPPIPAKPTADAESNSTIPLVAPPPIPAKPAANDEVTFWQTKCSEALDDLTRTKLVAAAQKKITAGMRAEILRLDLVTLTPLAS